MAVQETELTAGGAEQSNLLSKENLKTGMDKKDEKLKDFDNISLPDESVNHRFKTDETLHALSGLYAQFITVVAAILVFTELLHGPVSLFFFQGYVFTFLVGGGILCFLGAYISMLTNKWPGCKADNEKYFSAQFVRSLFFSEISIYLRIGSVVFGIGALISSGLEMASIWTVPQNCTDELNWMQPILLGLFSFLQMHFMFMNSKEMVGSFHWFRHIALMHLVATNLAVWIKIMLWGCAKDWLHATHIEFNSTSHWEHSKLNISLHTLESDIKSTDITKHKPTHKVYVKQLKKMLIGTDGVPGQAEDLLAYHFCIQNSTIGTIWEKAMPYLYTFNVQYCLVAAAILYITWSNLQKNRIKLQRFTAVSVYGRETNEDEINCAGSTRGLLLGLLILVGGIIVLILFFVFHSRSDKVQNKDKDFNVLFLIGSLECGIFGLSVLAAIIGLLQIRSMRSKTTREQRLTELLQRIGLLAVYIYGICNIIAGGNSLSSENFILLLHGIFMVIQACLQSLFIHQVSKKRLSPLNLDEKPGRQVVIFLVFCNIALWILESFTTPNQVRSKLQLKFFGKITWPVVSRIIMPFVIFYRFHSAVALMEAWRKSYKIKHN